MSFLSLFPLRGLFVKLVATFLLISVPVLAIGMYLDVHFSSARFERDVRSMLGDLRGAPVSAGQPIFDPADPQACRALADSLFWQTVQAGAREVSDFDMVLADFHAGRLHVAVADNSGLRCGTSPAPTAVLAAALVRAATAAESFTRDEDGWTMVHRLDLPGGQDLHALVGVRYINNWPEPATTAYDVLRTLLFIGALGAGIAGAMVWLVVRRVRRATAVADRWASGDLSARIDDRSHDEFSALAVRFNRMADTLAGSMERDREQSMASERHRMARDLHDTAKQRSFVLGLKLTELEYHAREHPELLLAVRDSRRLVDHLQQDLARAVTDPSRIPTVQAWGLRESLTRSIDDLLQGSAIAWSLALPSNLEQALQDHRAMAQELVMITREAVANALRHSRCATVRITATLEQYQASWTIIDDGQGFTSSGPHQGMGLNNMRWRADTLPSGRLAVTSDTRGTRVTASFLLAIHT